jgi:hypothetical protein
MQRLYFNFKIDDVRLVPEELCPALENETSFPNMTNIPDNVTMEMISFKYNNNGSLYPIITYPSIPVTK